MLPFLTDDLELEKDFVSPPLDLRYQPVERLCDGVRVKVLEPSLVDPNELSKFDARDFQLQEILDTGSYDLLTPVQPISLSRLSSLEVAERCSADLDSYVTRLEQSFESLKPVESSKSVEQ